MAIGGVAVNPFNLRMGGNSQVSNMRQPSLMDAAGASIGQTGSDYDSIMGQYRKLLNTGPSTTPLSYNSINPTTAPYQANANVSTAMGNLQNLAQTGGYSNEDLANIRARGVSPIRAIYANAQQNLNRSRALQGGYSPGYGALTARMARDLSEQLAGRSTDLEAKIAEMVAAGKQQAAPQYAQFAGQESGRENQAAQLNAQIANQIAQFNAGKGLEVGQYNNQLAMAEPQRQLDVTRGMQSMYGTTPALASTFGNQALQQQQLQEQQRQFDANIRQRGQLGLLNMMPRGGTGTSGFSNMRMG